MFNRDTAPCSDKINRERDRIPALPGRDRGGFMEKRSLIAILALIFLTVSASAAISFQGASSISVESGYGGRTLNVISVEESSIYDKAGLRQGDWITQVDFRHVVDIPFTSAVDAVSAASLPGRSVILTVNGENGYRIIRISSPIPDARQEAFIETEKRILEAWDVSREGWEILVSGSREFALGRISSEEISKIAISSRSAFSESRNRLISVEIPSFLSPEVRSALTGAKSSLANANMLRSIASGVIVDSIEKGTFIEDEDPIWTEDKSLKAAGKGFGYLVKARYLAGLQDLFKTGYLPR